MAKAKKQPQVEAALPAAQESAVPKIEKKSPAKKAAKSASPAAVPSTVPMIDTSLAAQTAAKLVAHRDPLPTGQPDQARQESSAFKQLKEGLHKTATSGAASFLQSTAPVKKQNSSFGGMKQVGRNQTFGADVNRSGVPRRTGG